MMRNDWIWGKFWRESYKKTQEQTRKTTLGNRLDMEYAGKREVRMTSELEVQTVEWVIMPLSEWRALGKINLCHHQYIVTSTPQLPLPTCQRAQSRVSNLPNIQRLYVRDHRYFRTHSCLYPE